MSSIGRVYGPGSKEAEVAVALLTNMTTLELCASIFQVGQGKIDFLPGVCLGTFPSNFNSKWAH